MVSIHARVERATYGSHPEKTNLRGFNPRTRRACDRRSGTISPCSPRFNPRTRRACDLGQRKVWLDNYGFNPRTRRACDCQLAKRSLSSASFNPRTRRACDDVIENIFARWRVSIHARVERATCLCKLVDRGNDCFNPRTRRACDQQRAPGSANVQ